MTDTDDFGTRDEVEQGAEARADEQRSRKPQVDLTSLKMASSKEWKGGGRSGCGPWVWAIIAALVVALLAVGYVALKQSVWVGFDKRLEKLIERVAIEVPTAERERLAELLEQFSGELQAMRDPYPVMGEFSKRATAALADGRVSRRELLALIEYLEAVLAGTEAPPR